MANIRNIGITKHYEDVSKQNKDLVNDYINYCYSVNKSPITIVQYREWLKVFFSWNYEFNGDKFFIELRKRDFINYIAYLRSKKMSPNRMATLISVLNSFGTMIEQLYDIEYPTYRCQTRKLEYGHKKNIKEKTILDVNDVRRMLEQLVSAGRFQCACYLAMACASGARKRELIQFKVSDFADDHLVFYGYMYRTHSMRTKGKGEDGKELNKYVIKELAYPYLKLWLDEREKKGITSEYLFVNPLKEQATIDTADSLCRTISKECGVHFYSHSARHFFCTYLIKEKKFPEEIVRLIIGWESIALIKTYNDTTDAETLQDYFKDYFKGEKNGE